MAIILVVDDDGLQRSSVDQILSGEGWTVATAGDAIDGARQFVDDAEIRLVLSDLNMGGGELDGSALYASIKDELDARGGRLVLMTNVQLDQDPRVAALRLAGVTCTGKCNDIDELLLLVRNHLP